MNSARFAKLFAILTGLLLMWSGIQKLFMLEEFGKNLEAFQLLSENLLAPASVFIPVLEITIGAALLIPKFQFAALPLSAGLMMFYALVILVSLANRMDIHCGCTVFASGPPPKITALLVIRNTVWAFGLLICLAAILKPIESNIWRFLLECFSQFHFRFLLTGIFALMVGEILMLTQVNHLLLQKIPEDGGDVSYGIKSGDTMEDFKALQIGNGIKDVRMKTPENKIVLVFNINCPFCNQQIPEWNRRYENDKGLVEFIGICPNLKEETEKFVKDKDIRFPVYLPSIPSVKDYLKKHRIYSVPLIIDVGPMGRVMAVTKGMSSSPFEQE